jgi:hypothetical protein
MSNVTNLNEETRNMVTIDDVEYVFEDLPQDVQNILAELSYVNDKINDLGVEQQRHEMMRIGYTTKLGEEMKKVQQ